MEERVALISGDDGPLTAAIGEPIAKRESFLNAINNTFMSFCRTLDRISQDKPIGAEHLSKELADELTKFMKTQFQAVVAAGHAKNLNYTDDHPTPKKAPMPKTRRINPKQSPPQFTTLRICLEHTLLQRKDPHQKLPRL